MRTSKKMLVDIAIQSIRQRNDLSFFWEYIDGMRKIGYLASFTNQRLNQLIDEYQNLIYGKGMKLRDYDSKLSDEVSPFESRSISAPENPTLRVEEKRLIPIFKELSQRYGISVAFPPEPTEEAKEKGRSLLQEIGQKYGWKPSEDKSSWHHSELGLHIYCGGKEVRLIVEGKGIKRPCLSFRNKTFGFIKEDDVAALMITCILGEDMASHINKFSPGFEEKWKIHRKGGEKWTRGLS